MHVPILKTADFFLLLAKVVDSYQSNYELSEVELIHHYYYLLFEATLLSCLGTKSLQKPACYKGPSSMFQSIEGCG